MIKKQNDKHQAAEEIRSYLSKSDDVEYSHDIILDYGEDRQKEALSKAKKFLLAIYAKDCRHLGGIGGQAIASRDCFVCKTRYMCGDTASGGILCRDCRVQLKEMLREIQE
jgi:hypothetical protein